MTEKENANRHKLTFEGKEVTLVGTAHVSRESADLVTRVIEEERPETVCIELCQSRYHAMTQKKQGEEGIFPAAEFYAFIFPEKDRQEAGHQTG